MIILTTTTSAIIVLHNHHNHHPQHDHPHQHQQHRDHPHLLQSPVFTITSFQEGQEPTVVISVSSRLFKSDLKRKKFLTQSQNPWRSAASALVSGPNTFWDKKCDGWTGQTAQCLDVNIICNAVPPKFCNVDLRFKSFIMGKKRPFQSNAA